jgi:GNAT superfamily N-acetyltransferase
MEIVFSVGGLADADELAKLHVAVAADLTHRFGHGGWSVAASERGILSRMKHSRVMIARSGGQIVGSLQLQNKKPWAIDTSYFTAVKKAIYLTGMAVVPGMQRQRIGSQLLAEAVKVARDWPSDAIRLDAFDAEGGAGGFYARNGFVDRGRVTYRNSHLIYFEMLMNRRVSQDECS